MSYTRQTWTNGSAGGTPLSAARLAVIEDGIYYGQQGIVNVKEAGATGDGTTDDAAAIQSAIDGSTAGDLIYFPPGVYAVGAAIQLKENRSYMGSGGLHGQTEIKAKTGITGGAVLCAEGWYDSSSFCDDPIRVTGLRIDANSQSNVHGLVVYNFWSRFEDLQIENVSGSSADAIRCTDVGRDGVTVTANSHSENCFDRIRITTTASGANGFHAISSNGASNQDGRISDSFIASVNNYGIFLERAAGWYVTNNHLYSIGNDAIRMTNCYATVVTGNYVEDFGGLDAASGFYVGINFSTMLSTRASICVGNTVSTNAPSSPTASRFTCFQARAGTSQTRAMLVMSGNSAVFAGSSAPAVERSHAFRFGSSGDSGRLLTVEWGANHIEQTSWWESTRVISDTDTVTIREQSAAGGVVALTDGASVALDAPMGDTFTLTAAGNRTISVPTNPADGQVIRIAHTASGADRTLALTTGSAGAFAYGTTITGLTATTSGTTDYITAVYSLAADRWRVIAYVKGY